MLINFIGQEMLFIGTFTLKSNSMILWADIIFDVLNFWRDLNRLILFFIA